MGKVTLEDAVQNTLIRLVTALLEQDKFHPHTLLLDDIMFKIMKGCRDMPGLPTIGIGSKGHYVKLLQMDLNGLALNYNNFTIDGIFDSKTSNATKNFQDRFEIKSDGIVRSLTWKLLIENVKAVQKLLNSYGYHTGYPDGWFGSHTTDAVRKFQNHNGLSPSGIVEPRTRRKLFNPHPQDNIDKRPSLNDINSLQPHVAMLARRFLELTRSHNLDVKITQAFRSWDESDRLFAQGRTTPGPIVSNARGGDSYHNWGLAFDAAPVENSQVSNDIQKYFTMGHLGEQLGLKWGGTFKTIVDYPHFQYTFGLNTWDLLNGITPPK
ncbi:peptidoglycan L-alanyl-D-glutamate endopeptidase CwlK [Neobacillus ginsengisoli]|uniref:Peptidoglycan L-alanyl-D-glutamate endopeptidase CwlK n=2 Tax=Neobacillus ginsengisoli TaxID=904295 RepID=A0ABT9Y2W9_9BACI|nr:peptidoglycan L-alanyl-D-glutamate endopeptidase CwlK [Neobacillus ginsengisoli]